MESIGAVKRFIIAFCSFMGRFDCNFYCAIEVYFIATYKYCLIKMKCIYMFLFVITPF